MAQSIFYKIIQVMSRKNVSSLPSRKARLAELLFYFIFFSAFHGFDFNAWLYAGRQG